MASFVQQGHEVVHSLSYRPASAAFTGKMETEAAKKMAKTRLKKPSKKNKKRLRIQRCRL